MSYRQCLPAPPLRHLIAAYWTVDGADELDAPPQRVLPDGCADLICDLASVPTRAYWVGTMTRAIEVPSHGRRCLFGVRFAAGGLYPWLGASLAGLTDTRVAWDALPARRWQPPLAGWCEDTSFAARCARADASFLRALPRLPSTELTQWLRVGGDALVSCTVPALSQRSGVTMRSLQRRFVEQLGVSPRQHLRYLRFERACRLMRSSTLGLVEVALMTGYADQPHFSREFRRFAGITPARWR
ncbi:MAG: helix-turn-helix transcriptional regulator [Dyella sp.]